MVGVVSGGGGWVEALTRTEERPPNNLFQQKGEQAGEGGFCEKLIDYIDRKSFTGVAHAFTVNTVNGFIVKRELIGVFKDSVMMKLRVRATFTTSDFEEHVYNDDCKIGQRDYITALLLTCIDKLSLRELSEEQLEDYISTSGGWQEVELHSWTISHAIAKKLRGYNEKH